MVSHGDFISLKLINFSLERRREWRQQEQCTILHFQLICSISRWNDIWVQDEETEAHEVQLWFCVNNWLCALQTQQVIMLVYSTVQEHAALKLLRFNGGYSHRARTQSHTGVCKRQLQTALTTLLSFGAFSSSWLCSEDTCSFTHAAGLSRANMGFELKSNKWKTFA